MHFTNYAETNLLNFFLGNTAFTPPANWFMALHLATQLNANAAIGANTIVVDHQPPNDGSEIVIDFSGASPETFTITNVVGAGPFTVTLSGTLVNAHNTGENVAYDPGDDVVNLREPVGGAYARASIANTAVEWPVTAVDQKSNANAIAFAQATAPWGMVTHTVLFDALAAGNAFLTSDRATVGEQVNTNTTLTIDAGAYTVRLA